MNSNDPRPTAFLAAARRLHPQLAQAAETVISDSLDWSSAHPDLVISDRENETHIFQVELSSNNRVIWAARTYKTTGAFISVLGWNNAALRDGFEDELIQDLNMLRRDGPLRPGAELRIRVADLQSPGALSQLRATLDRALARARAAA